MHKLTHKRYENIGFLAASICSTPFAFVSLISEDAYLLYSSDGTSPENTIEAINALTKTILASPEKGIVKNNFEENKNDLKSEQSRLKYFAGIAIHNHEGNPIGSLCVAEDKPFDLTNMQQEGLMALAEQLSELIERHQAPQLKLDAETELNSLLDSLGQGVYELDENGICIYANSAMVKITDYSIEDFVGDTVWKYVHEEDLSDMQAFYIQQLKSQSPACEYEYRIIGKHGDVKWLHHETTMSYENGRMVRIRTVARDITKAKKTEEDRDHNANLFKLFSENTTDIICLHRLDSTYEYVSSSIKEKMGFEPDYMLNKRPSEFIHQEDINIMRTSFKRLLEGKVVEPVRCRWKRADHSFIWLESHTRLIKNDIGEITAIQSSSKDVTQKHNEELQLISYKEGLTMLNILASIPEPKDVLIPIALKELAIYFNLNFAVIKPIDSQEVSYSYSRIKGGNPLVEFFKDPKNTTLVDGEIKAYYKDSPEPFKSYLALPIYDDSRLHSELILASFNNLENRFHPFVVEFLRFFSNWVSYVYKTSSTYQQLKVAKEKAEEAAKEKENFLSTISHEIRTPLNGIIGSVHLLSIQNKDQSLNEKLKVLRFSSDNLLSLVNDVLDYNKISSGNLELESSSFNLRHLLNSIHANYQSQADEKGLKLVLEVDSVLADNYLGDSVRISQVLNNLIGNAIKFTKQGEVKIAVDVKFTNKDYSKLRFFIIDSGLGIAREKTEIIFEVFKQAENYITREFGGSGLGLSITKNLLHLMGSEIKLQSELGKGSTFYFDLKLKVSSIKKLSNPKARINERLDLKVLLVEDNIVNRMIAREFLKNWGAQVIEAKNGKEAVETLKDELVDIVLLDLQMPVMDGYEAIGHIRLLNNANSKVPVIALTAESIGKIDEKVKKIGMNGLITKPFHPKDLYQKIVSAVNLILDQKT
ncbi:MAG: PAS domain S-box protein [Cyclobacteriaceae bacterium]